MAQNISPLAGKLPPESMLVDVDKLIAAYHTLQPDPSIAAQRVAFGTSGHRGSSFQTSFNEHHVLAITQAMCDWRVQNRITGPLFMGIDTHPLSTPACITALEVLAANGVEVMLSEGDEYTPTPALSHAILTYNRGRTSDLADGIVITPSHNPPEDGGFKYNPTHGGPAGSDITKAIEQAANVILEGGLTDVKRMPHAQALRASTTHRHDYLSAYVSDLVNVVDLDLVRDAGLHLGVDPLGGAGVNYWGRIGEQYGLDLTVINKGVDPTFRFMTVDWDGRIRMDPSSSYAMQSLLDVQDKFDIAFACDTDHDRHGIVTRGAGLLKPNQYLSVCIDYLFQNRPQWSDKAAAGKTVVSTSLIDRVVERLNRRLYEVPVGFKYFAPGLEDGSLGFGGEESAGASFLRRDGSVWTTDKDGIATALLAAEITARSGRDPGEYYATLTAELGESFTDRVDAPANTAQKKLLGSISADQLQDTELAGEKITRVLTKAPGNDESFGGIKVMTDKGWFAARPSGTEDIYKIYGESFESEQSLQRIFDDAQKVVDRAIGK
ncbi:phosphoglucomutase (alpha-D-glucose-1,6-bisphosphate-dependent) [Granulosicoccus antarcticus]|uniref:Phosphoglucomutase n=1 Tax=Granulosicoccus antarcticus IMCC3135 TaxID=1192854 RepID=A0A2Z2NPD4_9GAMM|nr:phosphoglucomutase (alpha-D-glucose-1,6-bisphosphate-dependent) [Granulosicoccus antarcticus]ASJ72325.1 Phosphoglucomutase [Granulosicoccus antarcticus IMCC3135]